MITVNSKTISLSSGADIKATVTAAASGDIIEVGCGEHFVT